MDIHIIKCICTYSLSTFTVDSEAAPVVKLAERGRGRGRGGTQCTASKDGSSEAANRVSYRYT